MIDCHFDNPFEYLNVFYRGIARYMIGVVRKCLTADIFEDRKAQLLSSNQNSNTSKSIFTFIT